ncbi:MAG: hypothetical protein NTY36_03690 [Deltaproteobacteria bacterium]|nr:hypothetical protein [Deltaproteobacteria bacterium]
MKLALLKRTIISIILAAALLPVSLAFGGLPGPLPPPPPAIPTPPITGYDYYKTDAAPAGDPADQIEFAPTGKSSMIAEYGGTGNVNQYAAGDVGNDWLLQVGGEKNSNQGGSAGSGNDTVYQFGGKGESIQYADGGPGNKIFIQVGGSGKNNMTIRGGTGQNSIEQYGGRGDNIIEAKGGHSDDIIKIYGGPGKNTIQYNLTAGNDVVTILGGVGHSTLTINQDGQNLTLKDYQGDVLFKIGDGGTTITVANLQRITVIGDAGKPIFTYNAGIVPSSIAPLLLLVD